MKRKEASNPNVLSFAETKYILVVSPSDFIHFKDLIGKSNTKIWKILSDIAKLVISVSVFCMRKNHFKSRGTFIDCKEKMFSHYSASQIIYNECPICKTSKYSRENKTKNHLFRSSKESILYYFS